MKKILLILFLKQSLIGMLIGTSAVLGGNFLMASLPAPAPELVPGYGYGLCTGGLLVYVFIKATEIRRMRTQLNVCKSPLDQN